MRKPARTIMRLALLLWICSLQVVHAQINALYLNANIGTTPNMNMVLGYSNDGSGNLTPLPGSPYLTSGTGSAPYKGQSLGLQTEDDQQVILNNAGTLLMTVNGYSNTVAVFTINSDASLTAIPGSPFDSHGPQPASLTLLDGALGNGQGLLLVVNKRSDTKQKNAPLPNLQTFTVGSDGTLTYNSGSQITLPQGASPSQAALGRANLVFPMQFAGTTSQAQGATPLIYSYRMQPTGHLKPNNIVDSPTGNPMLGEAVHPTQTILYAGLPVDSQIAVYQYDPSTGVLTLETTVTTPGLLPCWFAINQAGTRLYSAESMSNSITVFDLTNPLLPVLLQHIFLTPTMVDSSVTNVRFDPTGKFLYALSNSPTGSALHILNAARNGSLTESITPLTLPVPAGNFPIGLATLMK